MLEQANCLLWQAAVCEVFPTPEWENPTLFDPERGTALDWNIRVVNEAADVPSWLPVAREAGESVTTAWLRSRDPEDGDAANALSLRALWTGQPRYTQTFRNRMADGTIRWVFEDVRIEDAEDEDPWEPRGGRQPVRRWRLTGVVTDVTERVEAELAREAALRELEASRADMRRVVERANCLLWQGTAREVSAPPGWAGFVADPVRGTKIGWDLSAVNETEVLRWLPLDRKEDESFFDAWARARHPGDAEGCDKFGGNALVSGAGRYQQVFRVILKDGTVRWLKEDVHVEGTEETEPVGGPISARGPRRDRWHLVGVVTDVTERMQAEERQRALAEDLRRSNAVLQEFAYIASHDLKEPLRKIQTFGDMLQRKAREELGPDARDYLDRMTGAAGRMRDMIQGLLDYSRITGRPAEMAPVDLNGIVAEVVTDLEIPLAAAGGRVEVGVLPTIVADPAQMRQLFQHLIANALKFHHPGVPPLVTVTGVTAESRRDGDGDGADIALAILAIADNGIGFEPQHGERIFQIFERLAGRSGGREGCGVGLSICQKIAQRHGGMITAEGRPGEGATFTVMLPVTPSAA